MLYISWHSSASGASHSENPDGGEERRGEEKALLPQPGCHSGLSREPQRPPSLLEVPSAKRGPPLSVSGARAKEMPTNPSS